MDERLTELEIKLTFQDDLIGKLNDAIVELRREVAQLNRRLEQLERAPQPADDERA